MQPRQRIIFATLFALAVWPATDAVATNDLAGSLQRSDHLIQRCFLAPKDSVPCYGRMVESILTDPSAERPEDARVLTRLALVNGLLAQFEGNKEKVERVRRMDRYCRLAIERDSSNAMAHILLGVLNYRLCRLSWIERALAKAFIGHLPAASLEDSEAYLREAIRLQAECPYAHYALGRTLEALDRKQEALRAMRAAVELDASTPIDVRYQEKAEDQIAAIEARIDHREKTRWMNYEDF